MLLIFSLLVYLFVCFALFVFVFRFLLCSIINSSFSLTFVFSFCLTWCFYMNLFFAIEFWYCELIDINKQSNTLLFNVEYRTFLSSVILLCMLRVYWFSKYLLFSILTVKSKRNIIESLYFLMCQCKKPFLQSSVHLWSVKVVGLLGNFD